MSKKKATKKFKEFQCPSKLPKGNEKKKGPVEPCWRVEKLKRFKKTGYVTTFYDRNSGRRIGYGKGYLTTGKDIKQICGVSPDPFRAIMKDKSTVSLVGELCIRLAKSAQKPKKRKKRA